MWGVGFSIVVAIVVGRQLFSDAAEVHPRYRHVVPALGDGWRVVAAKDEGVNTGPPFPGAVIVLLGTKGDPTRPAVELVWRTDDGGVNWVLKGTPSADNLRDLSVVDAAGMTRFARWVEERHGVSLEGYDVVQAPDGAAAASLSDGSGSARRSILPPSSQPTSPTGRPGRCGSPRASTASWGGRSARCGRCGRTARGSRTPSRRVPAVRMECRIAGSCIRRRTAPDRTCSTARPPASSPRRRAPRPCRRRREAGFAAGLDDAVVHDPS